MPRNRTRPPARGASKAHWTAPETSSSPLTVSCVATRDAIVTLGRSVDDSDEDTAVALRQAWGHYSDAEASQRATARAQHPDTSADTSGDKAPSVTDDAATAATSAYDSYRKAMVTARRRATREAEDTQAKGAAAIDGARRAAVDAVRAAYVTYLERLATAFERAVDLDPASLDAAGRSLSSAAMLTQRALSVAEPRP